MKCLSCDVILSDREATRKGSASGDYVDLCDHCLGTIPDFEYVENPSLSDRRYVEEDTVTNEEQENV